MHVINDLFELCARQCRNLVVNAGQAVVDVNPEFIEKFAVLVEGVFVKDLDRVAKHDRVRDLHHRRLHVQ